MTVNIYLMLNVGCHIPMSLFEKVLLFFTFDSLEQFFNSMFIAVHFLSVNRNPNPPCNSFNTSTCETEYTRSQPHCILWDEDFTHSTQEIHYHFISGKVFKIFNHTLCLEKGD
jgi:hypothetical protein